MESDLPAFNAAILPLALSGGHMRDARLMSALAPPDRSDAIKKDILDFLAEVELIGLSTIGAAGWPVSHCMHFATVAGPGSRPVIYMFTHDRTRKFANIQINPRVAITVFRPETAEDPDKIPYLKMQGVATHVTDNGERDLAMQSQFNKVNYEFARFIGLETQPALRVDILNAVWEDAPRGRTALSVDYGASFQAGA